MMTTSAETGPEAQAQAKTDADLVRDWQILNQQTVSHWLEIHRRGLQRMALGQDYDTVYPTDKNFYHVRADGSTYQLWSAGSLAVGTAEIDDDDLC